MTPLVELHIFEELGFTALSLRVCRASSLTHVGGIGHRPRFRLCMTVVLVVSVGISTSWGDVRLTMMTKWKEMKMMMDQSEMMRCEA